MNLLISHLTDLILINHLIAYSANTAHENKAIYVLF